MTPVEANLVLQRVTGAAPAKWDDRLEYGVCELCGEPGSSNEAVGHFKHPDRFGDYVMAHGECGLDAGLELA